MDFTIFLLPLLGGFLFLISWYRARYFALRWRGYRLFFVSASVGFALLALAFAVTQGLLASRRAL